jgi:hypothetical protein
MNDDNGRSRKAYVVYMAALILACVILFVLLKHI